MVIFSSIAVYKALYKSFGGFAADVVAGIDQVRHSLKMKVPSSIWVMFVEVKI